jgi:outer membrane PBP1 activator LpoA protein
MHGFFHLSQTNFLVFNLFKQKHTNVSFILLILITLFISACSSSPTTKKESTPIKESTPNEVKITATAEEKLAEAQSLNTKSPRNEQSLLVQQVNVNKLLIEASELFVQQQDFAKALLLANEITEFYQEDYQNTYTLLVIKARSLFGLNYLPQALQQLQLANELVNYTETDNIAPSLQLSFDYYQVLSQILAKNGHNVSALTAQLNAFSLNTTPSNEDIQAIWHNLEILPQWQLKQLINNKPPLIKGWATLLNYSHQFGANAEQFSRYLNLWQQQNPEHPAVNIIEQLKLTNVAIHNPKSTIENSLDALSKGNFEGNNEKSSENTYDNSDEIVINRTKNIAILLPLTGTQQKAGLAAQQGILAAYESDNQKHSENNIESHKESNIYFIDTNEVNWENLATQFSELNINHIIGPLLKQNVELFLASSIQHSSLQVPTLLLNLPSEHQLSEIQVALSMRPEDEAVQAAATLSQQDYHNPMILSHNDRVSKRIAHAFRQQWQTSTGKSLEIVYFTQGKQMQASLKENLDVNASQDRIKQLGSQLKNNIKSEARNRRDIDMIYLIGSAAQTRLIKPYIDVNISPFAEIIPVYASSRSHSNFNDKYNASSTNDLDGLTFTQIPWLLASKEQDKPLSQLSDTLWPKRSDSLSRIFAMGFDSYQLLNKLPLMKQAPYIRHFGQTGELTLNDENILTRSLIWGQYKNNQVTQIGME